VKNGGFWFVIGGLWVVGWVDGFALCAMRGILLALIVGSHWVSVRLIETLWVQRHRSSAGQGTMEEL
jgi:hypothetical protein